MNTTLKLLNDVIKAQELLNIRTKEILNLLYPENNNPLTDNEIRKLVAELKIVFLSFQAADDYYIELVKYRLLLEFKS